MSMSPKELEQFAERVLIDGIRPGIKDAVREAVLGGAAEEEVMQTVRRAGAGPFLALAIRVYVKHLKGER